MVGEVLMKMGEPHRLTSLAFGLGSIIAGSVLRSSMLGFVLMGAGITATGMTVASLFNPVDISVNPAHTPEVYRATPGEYGGESAMTSGGAAWDVMRGEGVAHTPDVYRATPGEYGGEAALTSGGAAWSVNRAPVHLHTLSAVEGSGSVIGQ